MEVVNETHRNITYVGSISAIPIGFQAAAVEALSLDSEPNGG
jgi:hypothetical protein